MNGFIPSDKCEIRAEICFFLVEAERADFAFVLPLHATSSHRQFLYTETFD
jgi:hypothetical protein